MANARDTEEERSNYYSLCYANAYPITCFLKGTPSLEKAVSTPKEPSVKPTPIPTISVVSPKCSVSIKGEEQSYKTERLSFACDISGADRRFVAMIYAENGAVTEDRKHPKAKGSTGTDLELCGTNDYYHPEVVNDPNFKDWKWQMRKCHEMYKNGVRFYSLDARVPEMIRKNIISFN